SYAEWAGGRINRALDSLRDPAYSPGKESWRQEHRLGAKLFGQLAMAVAPLKLGGGGAANGGAKGLNPFRGKTFEQIDEILRAKGFVLKGPNPAAGKGSYLHPKTRAIASNALQGGAQYLQQVSVMPPRKQALVLHAELPSVEPAGNCLEKVDGEVAND